MEIGPQLSQVSVAIINRDVKPNCYRVEFGRLIKTDLGGVFLGIKYI